MDIATSADVAMLVDRFYGKVRVDALLGPIFNDLAQVDWPSHMATLYSFWETMLLGTGTYRDEPFAKHVVYRWRTRTSIAGSSCSARRWTRISPSRKRRRQRDAR